MEPRRFGSIDSVAAVGYWQFRRMVHKLWHPMQMYFNSQHILWYIGFSFFPQNLHLGKRKKKERKRYIKIASIWGENKLRYLPLDVICSEKRKAKTVIFEEQLMSKYKYPRILVKSNGSYRVYCPSNTFRKTWDLFKIREYHRIFARFS